MIESAVWTNIHNGTVVTFNDDFLPFTKFDTDAEWRQEQDYKPQDHGAFLGLPWLGMRFFRVEGNIMEMTSAEYITLRRTMMRSFQPSGRYGNRVVGRLDIQFTGMTEIVTSLCTLDGPPEIPMEALSPSAGEYMINWKSPDPRLLGASQFSAVTGVPGSSTGRTYPETYPKTYTAPSGVSGDLTIVNSGDIDVYPTWTILGPCEAPAVSLLGALPMTVEFGDLILGAGESVIIDFEQRTAIHSSGSDVYYTLTKREWWPLDVGTQDVRYSAFSASSPSSGTITWRNAYML
jgi:hypothetical protein